ncbi:MAG: CBS domain-containing protein, partial [Planctomycetota bacterium]
NIVHGWPPSLGALSARPLNPSNSGVVYGTTRSSGWPAASSHLSAVGKIMDRDMATVRPDEPLAEVLTRMSERGGRFGVVQDGGLVGLLTAESAQAYARLEHAVERYNMRGGKNAPVTLQSLVESRGEVPPRDRQAA